MTGLSSLTLGNATLYLGDAYKIVPTLGEVDCLASDPQYQFNAQGGGKWKKARPKHMNEIEKKGLNKGFDQNIINPKLHKSVVVFCHQNQIFKLGAYLEESYKRVTLCAWRKSNPSPLANKNYIAECELYFHAWNQGHHPLGEIKDLKRIIDYKNGQQSEFDHPTVKPLFVMDKIMRNINGNTILDPFAGTGSTGISALKAGKKFIGIEYDPVYFNIMVSRIYEFYSNASSVQQPT